MTKTPPKLPPHRPESRRALLTSPPRSKRNLSGEFDRVHAMMRRGFFSGSVSVSSVRATHPEEGRILTEIAIAAITQMSHRDRLYRRNALLQSSLSFPQGPVLAHLQRPGLLEFLFPSSEEIRAFIRLINDRWNEEEYGSNLVVAYLNDILRRREGGSIDRSEWEEFLGPDEKGEDRGKGYRPGR